MNISFKKLKIDILLILVIVMCFISDNIYNYLYNYFLFYLFILFHEISHVFIASIFNNKLNYIKLTLCGVYASIELKKYKFLVYIAGPTSNFILAYIFKSNYNIFIINVFLGLLNLIPIYPLDGYNILKCFVKEKTLKRINKIMLIIFFCFSLYLLIRFLNFSFLIFLIYISAISSI